MQEMRRVSSLTLHLLSASRPLGRGIMSTAQHRFGLSPRVRMFIAGLALLGIGLVAGAFITGGDSPSSASSAHATAPHSSAHPMAHSKPVNGASHELFDILAQQGFVEQSSSSAYSSDARRTVNSEQWTRGTITVDLMDDASGVFAIDTIEFGPTGKYSNFWCGNGATGDLDGSIAAGEAGRKDVLNGTVTPQTDPDAAIGTYEVDVPSDRAS